jgi:hypothetical protein
MNYEGCFRKVRKLITKPNEVSPWTKKVLQFDPITHGWLRIFLLNFALNSPSVFLAIMLFEYQNRRNVFFYEFMNYKILNIDAMFSFPWNVVVWPLDRYLPGEESLFIMAQFCKKNIRTGFDAFL